MPRLCPNCAPAVPESFQFCAPTVPQLCLNCASTVPQLCLAILPNCLLFVCFIILYVKSNLLTGSMNFGLFMCGEDPVYRNPRCLRIPTPNHVFCLACSSGTKKMVECWTIAFLDNRLKNPWLDFKTSACNGAETLG